MTRLPIWRICPDYSVRISRFCQTDGLRQPVIFPVVFHQKRLEQAIPQAKALRSMPAFSIGLMFPHIEWGGRVLAEGNFPAGLICFEEEFDNAFTDAEKEFILAHEYSHIFMNHSPIRCIGALASSIVKSYIAQIDDETAKQILALVWWYTETVVSTKFSRQSELDADAHALSLTGDRATAISTIEKIGLTFAGDLRMPSHYLLSGKSIIPILSYRDRIDAL